MKKRTFSRVLSFVLVLAMVFTIAPAPVRAAGSATYNRVTEAPADWEGEYLLVYEDGSLALDGSLGSPDAVNNYSAVTITDSSITMSDHSKAVYLEAVDGGYVLKTAAGLYLYQSSDANKLVSTANKDTAAKYPLTVTVTADGTDLALSVGPHLRFNNAPDQMRFRYYKSSTYTAQQPVALYKLDGEGGGSEEPEDPEVPAILEDGDQVVIYNPAYKKALSTTYNGYYNNGTDVSFSGESLTGFTADDVWTVGVNDDGTYTFATAEGQKLSMGDQFTSMPLDDVNTAWEVTPAATEGCYYVKNAVRGSYIEWYADKGNWSSYYNIGSNEDLFALAFWKVEGDLPVTGNLPAEGEQVMLYNVSAKGVLALQNDTTAINNALATVENGVVTAENGGLVFTVEKNGDYFRFRNETFGYLCSNGTGNNAFYALEASEDADWTLADYNGGYSLESRTAKYNGTYSQFLEYYADSYKTYSLYNVTDPDIYTFHCYPCGNAEGEVIGGVVNAPAVDFGTVLEAPVGMAYTLSFTVDTVFGVKEISAVLGETALQITEAADVYTVEIPAELVAGESLTVTVSGADNLDVPFTGTVVIPVKDEPVIGDVTPTNGSETLENKRPVISAAISNAGENAVITMTVNGAEVAAVLENGVLTYVPAEDMADGNVTVKVTVVRADGKTAEKTWRFTVGESQFQLYFGQLHAHTTYSDGAGSVESALQYIAELPDSANVDFVAFTDHSNYFDQSGAANPEQALYDMSLATSYSQNLWSKYKSAVAAFNESQSDVVAIGAFEMTWSGGPGHINTFNTPGIVSRNNSTLNNKTDDAGMKAYYALLSQPEGVDSISQFNHPGSTFGTFSDFAYWDPVIDSRIYLVEVGNGEGQIGAGGYFPSYEYYTMALDKGWHVSPTNNQDNHKGKWGNANNARDVILAENLSEESIYEAIQALRMYATEDKNLEIYYTVNGLQLGSSIVEVPEKLDLKVTVSDPDATDTITKVEVIVNSGKTAYTWDDPAELASGELTAQLDPTYSYYYIRVTQGDGDLAVTTPVWVGESLKLGISSLVCGTATPVTDEELTLTTTLFNSETSEAAVKTITYAVKGGEVLGVDNTGYTVPASGTLAIDWNYIPTAAKVFTITATVVMELDGEEYVFTMDIELDVQDAEKLIYIGVDASHYNEYVSGNYKDSMGNLSLLAAEYSVRLVTLNTTEDLIAACENEKFKAIILTAPSRRLGAAQEALLTYTEAETAAILAFNEAGGMVILAGWSDYYEYYPSVPSIAGMTAEQHMAATQNALLEALGSSLRITDDATHDNELNGGQTQRLYFNSYNFDSFLVDGVEVDEANPNDRLYTEVFSQYGGATIHVVDGDGNMTAQVPETVTPVVFGHASTYSKDSDNDGIGGDSVPKYTYAEGDDRLLVLATEQLDGRGLIVVSGAAFMSNFEVQATIEDSGSEKNYSNYRICENLIKAINPATITDISEVAAQTEAGYKYTIEGVVTSNASGYDRDTAFFDCIYVQDATGGICCFPVAGEFKLGDIVRVTGVTEFYQGEPELQVSTIEKIGQTDPVEPETVTAAQINDRSVEGKLVKLSGTVVSYEIVNGLVQTILVEDENGNVARVFIDGYITVNNEVQNLAEGAQITVVGCASYDDTFNAPEGPFPRIRVRDRADVVCTYHDCPSAAFSDLDTESWYHEYTDYVIGNGLMNGMDEGVFAPETATTRGMLITVLYRMAGCPEAETEAPFVDVAEDRYYSDAIDWAWGIGIAKGMTDTVFAPDAELTREQTAAFLYRYLASSVMPLDEISFPDWEDVSDYAEEAMTWAVAVGLFEGYEDGTLRPQAGLTRAEAAKILTIIDSDF